MAGIDAMGFITPTPIQSKAIPVALEGRDVMGLAQTGTGKTAAFLLPILQRLTTGPLRRVRALVVAPTRELADQIQETAVMLSRKTRISSVTVYGGVNKNPQIRALRHGSELVVACPGRLLDLHSTGDIDLSHVEVLVLDEADRMCDMGFLPDIKRILQLLPSNRQNLFFSATMPPDIRGLADQFLHQPERVQIGMIAPAKTVEHALYPVSQKQKKNLLLALLPTLATGRVLVFTRTKYRARNLARDLGRKGYKVAALQGNMSQNQRVKAMSGFREGKYDMMIATDIAARGLDVAEITHVINFDMPATVDDYTHRIGRTGRARQDGEALTFMIPDDLPLVRRIERLLKKPIERRYLDGFAYGQKSERPAVQADAPAVPTADPTNASGPQHRRRSKSKRQQSSRRKPQARQNGRAQGESDKAKSKRRRRRSGKPKQAAAG